MKELITWVLSPKTHLPLEIQTILTMLEHESKLSVNTVITDEPSLELCTIWPALL